LTRKLINHLKYRNKECVCVCIEEIQSMKACLAAKKETVLTYMGYLISYILVRM
jgi:hypothetical protein